MKIEGYKLDYPNENLYSVVLETSKKFPKHVAYNFMGNKVSYKKFITQIDLASKSLINLGVKKGDIVCIASPNIPNTIILFYAVNKIGAIANMIHPLSSERELYEYITGVNAKTILICEQFFKNIENIIDKTSLQNVIIASVKDYLPLVKKTGYTFTQGKKIPIIEKTNKIILWKDFIKNSKKCDNTEDFKSFSNDIAVMLYSGGTTGKIKNVCLTNLNINACTCQMLEDNKMISSTDKMLSVMPIFHGNGLVIGIHTMLSVGAECVLIPRFTPKTYVHDLLKHKCNYMSGVPTLFEKMICEKEIQNADLSFLKGAFSGADYLPIELERKINNFLKEHNASIKIRQGYGMTEGVVASTLNPTNNQKEGSIGLPFTDVICKIVEPNTDNELKNYEVGEIVFNSLTNMAGYYKNEEETNNVLKLHKDGKYYIHSGDLGYKDDDGFLYFKGRIKRMIVTNGYNVFPLELENVIEKCELVDRCCVVGVSDKERIEKVKAYIVLNKNYKENEETTKLLKEYFAKNIAKYAIPREIEYISDLPKTKVGKVDYKVLEK